MSLWSFFFGNILLNLTDLNICNGFLWSGLYRCRVLKYGMLSDFDTIKNWIIQYREIHFYHTHCVHCTGKDNYLKVYIWIFVQEILLNFELQNTAKVQCYAWSKTKNYHVSVGLFLTWKGQSCHHFHGFFSYTRNFNVLASMFRRMFWFRRS